MHETQLWSTAFNFSKSPRLLEYLRIKLEILNAEAKGGTFR